MRTRARFLSIVTAALLVSGCLDRPRRQPPPPSPEPGPRGMMLPPELPEAGPAEPTEAGPPANEPEVAPPPPGLAPCAPGTHACGGVCKSDFDVMACGQACDPCPTIAGGTSRCDGQKCSVECPPGQRPCDDRCIAENAPCGGCKDGKNLCGGICVLPDDRTACGPGCVTCPTSAFGTTACTAGACVLTCDGNHWLCKDRCLGLDQPCDGACPPGHTRCGAGCVPTAAVTGEICDGKDNDCDGMIDEQLVQDCGTCKECRNGACMNQPAGQDRKGECAGNGCNMGRCNACPPGRKVCEGTNLRTCANDGSRWNVDTSCVRCENQTCIRCTPSAEICDGRDNDCDGRTDEDLAPMPCNPSCAGNQTCTGGRWSTASCARTDVPDRCGGSCTRCPAPPPGGTATCSGGSCGVSCPGGKLCGGSCVPNAQLCDGQCGLVRCRFACVTPGTSCPATTPLTLFFHAGRLDNYTVGSPGGAANARQAGYGEAGVMGHAERVELPGTVALRCYFSGNDNLVTTGSPPAGYLPCANGAGGVEGYIYRTQRPGTVALKRWFSFAREEYHTVTTNLQADADLLGQSYVGVGIEGYVLSQPQ